MKGYNELFKNFTLITQFGLSLMMPLLLCMGICWLVCDKLGVGVWIYIIGFIMGLGSSFTTAYNFYLKTIEKQKKEEEKTKRVISFNKH